MKREILKRGCAAAVLAAVVFTMMGSNNGILVSAKKRVTNSTVTYRVKGSTLTLKGSGVMPASMKFGKKKKTKNITKVVIKKGVTAIADQAFENCRKLKSVSISSTVRKIGYSSFGNTALRHITLPDSVRFLGDSIFHGCKKLKTVKWPAAVEWMSEEEYGCPKHHGFFDGVLDKLIFTTPLRDISELQELDIKTKEYELSPKDGNYKSIGGSVYSKDGKELYYVSEEQTELKIPESCTVVHTSALAHCVVDEEDGKSVGCTKLKEIVIPAAVTKIVSDHSFDECDMGQMPIRVENPKLDGESVEAVAKWLGVKRAKEILGSAIEETEDFVICGGDYLYSAADQAMKKEKLTIPSGIRIIAPWVFAGCRAETVELPESLEEIREKAFYDAKQLKTINFPDALQKIGTGAFYFTQVETEIPARFQGQSIVCKEGETPTVSVPVPTVSTRNPESFPLNKWPVEYKGTGEYQYTEFTNEKRQAVCFQLGDVSKEEKTASVSVKIQRHDGGVWKDISREIKLNPNREKKPDEVFEKEMIFGLEAGEYRFAIKNDIKSLVYVRPGTSRRQYWVNEEKKAARKKNAAELLESVDEVEPGAPQYYRMALFSDKGKNTDWYKFQKQKKKKGTFRVMNMNMSAGKLDVSIYKEGKKKAVKHTTVVVTEKKKMRCAVKGKGTYYIKITRDSKKTTGEYCCAFDY